MLGRAIQYAEKYGFAVFPLHGIKTVELKNFSGLSCTCGNMICTNQGKHPAVQKGRNAASKEPMVIENLWAARIGLNIGVATGVESGIFVLDIDGITGEENLAKYESQNSKLPKTLTSITGRGRHLIFKYPSRKVFNRTNVLGEKVDVRGDGGYIVAPNSRHISGISYQWEDETVSISDAPQWLLGVICSDSRAPVVRDDLLSKRDNTWTENDVIDMLNCIDPSLGYHEWVSIGMAIKDGGYPFQLFDNWSKKSDKYDGSTAYHWNSFNSKGITMGTLVDKAKISGWKPRGYIEDQPMDLEKHPAKEILIKIGSYTPKKKIYDEEYEYNNSSGKLSFDPRNLPAGLIGDTVRFICETSIRIQPELALMNTLACLGSIYGRRYAAQNLDTRTNVYTVGIADTGSGKDNSRKILKDLMAESGLSTFIGDDSIKSGAGLLTAMSKQASCVMMLDEFGLILQSITGDKAAAHKSDIATMFLKLYSTSNSTESTGSYADKKIETSVLTWPHLCLYGTTTERTYCDALKKVSVYSGDLNRFIIIQGRKKPELSPTPKSRQLPDILLEMWRSIFVNNSGDNLELINNILIKPDLTYVKFDTTKGKDGQLKSVEEEIVNMLFFEEKMRTTSDFGELWCRYRENTIKIAMIFAISRDPLNPIISQDDLTVAKNITIASIKYMVEIAAEKMYENDVEKNRKDVFGIIKDKIDGVTKSEILRLNRHLRKKELEEILSVLVEEEVVTAEQEKTAGRPTVRYKVI